MADDWMTEEHKAAALEGFLANPVAVAYAKQQSAADARTVSTWEERMALRARERRPVEVAAASPEQMEAWDRFVTGHGGFQAVIVEGPRFIHAHPAHGNATFDAATGKMMGVFSVALDDGTSAPPDICPVCAGFNTEEWLA